MLFSNIYATLILSASILVSASSTEGQDIEQLFVREDSVRMQHQQQVSKGPMSQKGLNALTEQSMKLKVQQRKALAKENAQKKAAAHSKQQKKKKAYAKTVGERTAHKF